MEAWKSGLVSGPITHLANVMGNTTFLALRAPVDALAAVIGAFRSGPDVVHMTEPLARIAGSLHGALDGLKVAGAVLKTGDYDPGKKGEQRRNAIEGTKGEVIRLPFRTLAAEDALFRTMNERGEAYSLAVRSALKDTNPTTREFRERVADLVQHPTPEMQAEITTAGDRFTFNLPLGEKGQVVQQVVREWHLEWAVPFVRTPGNILKELTRMSPFASFIKEWRVDYGKGGAARDKALAEVYVGSSIAAVVTALTLSGKISGAGNPDQSKAATQRAAGWQAYSVKIGDKWYAYQRLQPVGTLMGVSADIAEVWEHLTPTERDRVPKMIAIAFANAVTHQTFLQGLTNIVNAVSDPDRFGPRFIQGMAGSVVPGAVAQTAQLSDPLIREIHSSYDAVLNRIPGGRQSLYPKRDLFGVEIPNKDRLGWVTPVTVTQQSTDPVYLEAARLNVGISRTPETITLPAARDRKLGDVPLSAQQRDKFAEVSGHMAYNILRPIVEAPSWGHTSDFIKKRIFDVVFEKSRAVGRAEVIPPEQRELEMQRITEELYKQLR